MNVSDFLKSPSLCHTATLPAEIRFNGILTENFTSVGDIYSPENYEQGFSIKDNMELREWMHLKPFSHPQEDRHGQILILQNGADHQVCEDEILNLDYKDAFHVCSNDGVQTLILPNDSEQKHYAEFDAKRSNGFILLCLARVSLTVFLHLLTAGKIVYSHHGSPRVDL